MKFYLHHSHFWCKIMRITFAQILIVTLFTGITYSKSISAQEVLNKRITLSAENKRLADILRTLSGTNKVQFIYNQDVIKSDEKLTFRFDNMKLKSILDQLLTRYDIRYQVYKDKIILIDGEKKENRAGLNFEKIKQVIVTGKVVDERNLPLIGVSVTIKGTTKGTITDIDGNFKIAVPNNTDILVFNYIGYVKVESPLNGTTPLTIKLLADSKLLNDVVVVGYGTQKRRNVTGAVTSFDAEKLDERPVTRIDQALVGQLAGVQVKQTSGAPGKGLSVQVRGSGSISASNEPLYVIDDFPLETSGQNATGGFSTGNPLDNINPNDIESIQVLKDASASAIYGSRAANGVVIITTKKGKIGKPKLTFNTYTGITKANRYLDVLSASEWVERASEIINGQWAASGPGRTSSQTNEQRRVLLNLPVGSINPELMTDDRWYQAGYPGLVEIDWQNELFRTGIVHNSQVAGSGGNEFVRYYASLNYANQDGIAINTGYKAYSGRANIDIMPSAKLKFGLNIAPTYSETNDPGIEGKDRALHITASMLPLQEANVGLDANTGTNSFYRWSAARNSPIRYMENAVGLTKTTRILSSAYANYEIVRGLTAKTTLNFDNSDASTQNYVPDLVSGNVTARIATPGSQATGAYNQFRKQTFVNENTLSYNTTINDKHDLSFLAGQSFNTTHLSFARLTATGGFSSSTIRTLNAAANISGTVNNYTTETKNVLLSYFGRAQYGYDGKYLLSATIRRDGSSRFGENNKFGWFPSVSVGWRVSQEKFLQHVTFLSELKLRASYGQSGNYNIGDYSSIPTLGFYNTSFGGALVSGQGSNRVANADLTWEKSITYNYGFDFGLIKNRITGSFDYYTRRNKDLLLNVPIPQTTGFATALQNVGEVLNKGLELEISSKNTIGEFQWSTSLNITHNSNEVIHLGPGDASILIPSSFDIQHSILQVGQAINSFYLVQQVGILTAADIANGAPRFGTQTVGDPKYLDANGDGKIDGNDRVISGHPNPDYTFGMTNNFKYKHFDLAFLIQGQTGGKIYSLFGRATDRTGQSYNENSIGVQRDRWRSSENPGDGERGKAYSTFGRIKNTDWLWSTDYWRIKTITLGYDLGRILPKKVMQAARLYVSAENWFGKDKYKGGWNPEAVNTDLSGNTSFPQGGDYGGLPLAKSLILGLNVTF